MESHTSVVANSKPLVVVVIKEKNDDMGHYSSVVFSTPYNQFVDVSNNGVVVNSPDPSPKSRTNKNVKNNNRTSRTTRTFLPRGHRGLGVLTRDARGQLMDGQLTIDAIDRPTIDRQEQQLKSRTTGRFFPGAIWGSVF